MNSPRPGRVRGRGREAQLAGERSGARGGAARVSHDRRLQWACGPRTSQEFGKPAAARLTHQGHALLPAYEPQVRARLHRADQQQGLRGVGRDLWRRGVAAALTTGSCITTRSSRSAATATACPIALNSGVSTASWRGTRPPPRRQAEGQENTGGDGVRARLPLGHFNRQNETN